MFSHVQEKVKVLDANPVYNRQESEPMYEYIDPEFFNRDRQKPEEEVEACNACAEGLGSLGYKVHKVRVRGKPQITKFLFVLLKLFQI